MSKERLEEIKELWQDDNQYCDPCTYEWLIEQAERFEILSEHHDESLKQNKRYREALESILNNDQMYITNEEIILKALEESE